MQVDLSVIKKYCVKIGPSCTECFFIIGGDTCAFNDFPDKGNISFIETAYSKILESEEAVEQPPTQAKAAEALPEDEICPNCGWEYPRRFRDGSWRCDECNNQW